jgi:2-oxoglutarate dehydrogenase E2 component (dihydrolipoamide succinyltransferase)
VTPITLPRLNANEDVCTLLQWVKKSGATVAPGDVVLVLQTTKATYDVSAEVGGVLHCTGEAGVELPVGSVVGYVFASEEERKAFASLGGSGQSVPPPSKRSGEFVLTKGAEAFAREHGVSSTELASLGRQLIRRSDIEGLLKTRSVIPNAATTPLTRRQLGMARVVTESHDTIPTAFLLAKARTSRLKAKLEELQQKEEVTLGLTEAMVRILALTSAEHKTFFGTMAEFGHVAYATSPGIGVTIDMGTGLFVPVVRGADRLGLREIAEALADFRMKALRDEFREDELQGGDITLSLNLLPGTLLSVPIVLPPQLAIVSIGAEDEELALDGEKVITRSTLHVGVSYDHRVLSGNEVGAFLGAIRQRIEDAEL